MPPRHCSKVAAQVELPEPLWAKIASHMSTKDWAMVSGTCKTFLNLHPGTFNIPCAIPLAGVIWASRRLGAVEVLRLSPAGALGLARTGVPDPDTLMRLKHLEIGFLSAPDTTNAFMKWFAWVLAHAQKLTLLSATVGHLKSFPPMVQLKHLVLRFNQSPGKVFAALPHATSLQTLSLHAGRRSGRQTLLIAQRLELSNLPKLRAVALYGVCPDQTLLPKECGLHLDGLIKLDTLGHERWGSASANLCSLKLLEYDLVLQQLPDLLGVFQKWKNLSTISIEVQDWGRANAPVSLAHLAHVQQLFICAQEAYVTVPAKISWYKFGLWGGNRLKISFEDMDAFARTVGSCAFTSQNLAGPFLFQLCLTLAEHGIPWASREHERGDTSLAFPSSDAGDFSGCFCGACMKCLRACSLAQADSHVISGEDANDFGEKSSDDSDMEYNDSSEEEGHVDSESDGELLPWQGFQGLDGPWATCHETQGQDLHDIWACYCTSATYQYPCIALSEVLSQDAKHI